MTASSGSYPIGPDNGTLTVSTYVGGMGSKMGHDLVFEATRWSGSLVLEAGNPAASSVEVTVEVESLEIVKAVGGLKPLSDKDKADIAQNRAKTLQSARYPQIGFRSTSVAGDAPALTVSGDMTIMGTSRPVTMTIAVADADGGGATRLEGKATVTQTDFGVKPYSKLGALKVKDDVDFNVVVQLAG